MTSKCLDSPAPNDRSSDSRQTSPTVNGPIENTAVVPQTHSCSPPSLNSSSNSSHTQSINHHDSRLHVNRDSSKKLTDTNSMECTGGSSVTTRNKLTNGDPPVNGVLIVKDTSRTKVDGLVLKNCRGPHLRHRPYTVTSKAATEPAWQVSLFYKISLQWFFFCFVLAHSLTVFCTRNFVCDIFLFTFWLLFIFTTDLPDRVYEKYMFDMTEKLTCVLRGLRASTSDTRQLYQWAAAMYMSQSQRGRLEGDRIVGWLTCRHRTGDCLTFILTVIHTGTKLCR